MRSTQGYARLCAGLAARLERLEARLAAGDQDALVALTRLRRALEAFGGARKIMMESADIGRWLREQAAALQQSSGLRVLARPHTADRSMAFDAEALGEALRALVDNSSRAGAKQLTLATELRLLGSGELPPECAPGEYLLLELRDDGAGIPASLRHRALWPGVSSWQREGLGLAEVQGIALAHGGWASIGAEPRGALVRLALPTGASTTAAGNPEVSVLVVDDEPLALKALRRVLVGRGYRVICAETGRAAIEQVEAAAEPPQLLVSDINMPGMNGPTLAAELRARIPDLGVLFVCGYPPEGLELPPGSRVLAKPFSHEELLSAVRQTIDALG